MQATWKNNEKLVAATDSKFIFKKLNILLDIIRCLVIKKAKSNCKINILANKLLITTDLSSARIL